MTVFHEDTKGTKNTNFLVQEKFVIFVLFVSS